MSSLSSVIRGKISPSIMARIEWLGQMNDRYKAALEAQDVTELLRLASEYSERGMVRTANEIYVKVSEMRGTPVTTRDNGRGIHGDSN